MPSDNDNVVLSISGLVISLSRKQLNKYPHTRLAQQFLHTKAASSHAHSLAKEGKRAGDKKQHQSQNADKSSQNVVVYFYNRNPLLFMHIVDYYRTGMLHFSHQYCWTAIADELEYWRIDRSCLAECCQIIYNDHKRRVESFRELQHIFGDDVLRFQSTVMSAENSTGFSNFRAKVAQFYNDPASSKLFKVKAYLVFYITVTLLYLLSYILQTETVFRDERPVNDTRYCSQFPIVNESAGNATDSHRKYRKYFTSSPMLPFSVIDGSCTFIFYVDLFLRYLGSLNARTFFTNAGHIVDCLCNICDLFAFWLHMSGGNNLSCSVGVLVIYLLLEVSRVFRVMRLIQFTNRYNGIKVLILTLRASLRELLLLLSVLGAGVVIFGFLIYVAELSDSESSKYENFTVGFWWAIVTMTTLGYGDIVPTTPAGYLIGSLCAITGVIFVALQVPVIANRFNALYTYACDQQLRQQWAKEEAFISGETSLQPGGNKRQQYNGETSRNPILEFSRQLQQIPTYYTPASLSLFVQKDKEKN